MINKILRLSIALLFLNGCGNQNLSDSPKTFSGNWNVESSLTQLGCDAGIPHEDPLLLKLSIEEKKNLKIVAKDSRGVFYSGQRETPWKMTITSDSVQLGQCTAVYTIKFFDADESYAKANIVMDIDCAGAFKCTRKYDNGDAILVK